MLGVGPLRGSSALIGLARGGRRRRGGSSREKPWATVNLHWEALPVFEKKSKSHQPLCYIKPWGVAFCCRTKDANLQIQIRTLQARSSGFPTDRSVCKAKNYVRMLPSSLNTITILRHGVLAISLQLYLCLAGIADE